MRILQQGLSLSLESGKLPESMEPSEGPSYCVINFTWLRMAGIQDGEIRMVGYMDYHMLGDQTRPPN